MADKPVKKVKIVWPETKAEAKVPEADVARWIEAGWEKA